MTSAMLIILAAAVLATFALAIWAWFWFAVHHESSAMASLGNFEGIHFDDLTADRWAGTCASPLRELRP